MSERETKALKRYAVWQKCFDKQSHMPYLKCQRNSNESQIRSELYYGCHSGCENGGCGGGGGCKGCSFGQ